MSLTNASPLDAALAARSASRKLAVLDANARNDALDAMHSALTEAREDVLAANARDLQAAAKAAQSGQLSQSLVKRLDLGKKGKYDDMLQGILDVKQLEDPSECWTVSVWLLVTVSNSVVFDRSWQDWCENPPRRRSCLGKNILTDRSAAHHFRGTP